MPVLGGTTLKLLNARLAPAQEHVALAVAAEFDLVVVLKRVRGAVFIDLHRVIDDELCRRQRIDPLRDSPPRRTMASRMAARSTMHGTPVKSCMITRAGVKAIS